MNVKRYEILGYKFVVQDQDFKVEPTYREIRAFNKRSFWYKFSIEK